LGLTRDSPEGSTALSVGTKRWLRVGFPYFHEDPVTPPSYLRHEWQASLRGASSPVFN